MGTWPGEGLLHGWREGDCRVTWAEPRAWVWGPHSPRTGQVFPPDFLGQSACRGSPVGSLLWPRGLGSDTPTVSSGPSGYPA